MERNIGKRRQSIIDDIMRKTERFGEYQERCKKANENCEFMIVYREKRAKTFAETLQNQLDKLQRQQKQTQEKLTHVNLTDCMKSPSRDPRPSVDVRTPVVMYLESFCQSLDAEQEKKEALTFLDILNQADINEPQPDILNFDSDQHVWDRDATEWLDNLIEELNEQSQLESLENNFDFENFVEYMTQA